MQYMANDHLHKLYSFKKKKPYQIFKYNEKQKILTFPVQNFLKDT